MADGGVDRAFRFPFDPSSAQEQMLASYCGAARFAYNWALAEVTANLAMRATDRAAGVAEGELTPSLSWSAYTLNKRWNSVKETVAPWWREVSMHAFRSGINASAAALKNWSESKNGTRKGRRRVGFPKFKRKATARRSVSFVEINHQLSWLHPDRHHIRLMLPASSHAGAGPQSRAARLSWVHTHGSTRR